MLARPLCGLCLAEKVEVHPQPLLAASGEIRMQQVGLRVEHSVGGFMPKMRADQGHRDGRESTPDGLKPEQQRLVQWAEETWGPLHIENMGELIRRPGGPRASERTRRSVQRGWPSRRGSQLPVEFGSLPAFARQASRSVASFAGRWNMDLIPSPPSLPRFFPNEASLLRLASAVLSKISNL